MDGFYHYDHKRSGVAAVEMAICLPFLLITVIGIIQFYRIVQVQQIINNAAIEGCKELLTASQQEQTAFHNQ